MTSRGSRDRLCIQSLIIGEDEALLLYRQVMELSRPSKRVFRVFKGWLDSVEPFVGIDAKLALDEEDFVTLNSSSETEILTRSLQQVVGRYMPVSPTTRELGVQFSCD